MNVKKILAFALAAVMTMSSATVVMASEPQPSTGTTGSSTQFAHLEKKVTNVVYPTIANESNPFNFIVDAERLIAAAGGKYKAGAVTLPSPDNGVYFETATAGTYAGTSVDLTVTNKSSHSVNVSATAKATVGSGETMMDLVASDAVTGTDAVKLYLGLTVGSDTKALTADADGVTATASVAGVPDNFEVVSKSDGTFEYKVKDGADSETGDKAWKTTTINMTGKVNTVTDVGTAKAPTVAVTWTYADPTANYTVTYNANYDNADPATATESVANGAHPTGTSTGITRAGYTLAGWMTSATGTETVDLDTISAATTLYAKWTQNAAAPSATATQAVLEADKTAAITVDLGVGNKAATTVTGFVNKAYGNDWIEADAAAYSNGVITITSVDAVNVILAEEDEDARVFTITFDDSDETSVEVTLTAKE